MRLPAARSQRIRSVIVVLAVALLCGSLALAQDGGDRPGVTPPDSFPPEVEEAFFDDALKELVGKRPDYDRQQPAGRAPMGVAGAASSGVDPAGNQANGWSKLIAADVLEDEIKAINQRLPKLVTTPSAFKGGAYRDCRLAFTNLATMFAIAAEHDQQPRWQREAAALAQLFGRAGANCKVGTDQSYAEAKLRRDDLADLIRGGRPATPTADPDAGWPQISDRPPLMERLELAVKEGISPWTANVKEFRGNQEELRREAQVVAALARVIHQEGYEYSDDETYVEYSQELMTAAQTLAEAAEKRDYSTARAAAGKVTQACATCHDGYRG